MAQGLVKTTLRSNTGLADKSVELLLDGDYKLALLDALRQVNNRVWVMGYDWRWSPDRPASDLGRFGTRVCQLAKIGRDVRVILDKTEQAKQLSGYGIKSRTLPGSRIMHSKVVLVDDKALLIGSHNLTANGIGHNWEASVVVRDPEEIALFLEYFERLWNNLAE